LEQKLPGGQKAEKRAPGANHYVKTANTRKKRRIIEGGEKASGGEGDLGEKEGDKRRKKSWDETPVGDKR